MRNGDKFKEIFGIYATELFAKSDKEFLEWLIADVPDKNVEDTISRQAAIATAISGRVRTLPTTEDGEAFLETERTMEDFTQGLTVPGKLVPKQIPGGTLLVRITYELR